MARPTSEQPPLARPRRRLPAAIALACCTLAAASIPAAAARFTHARPIPVTPAPTTGPAVSPSTSTTHDPPHSARPDSPRHESARVPGGGHAQPNASLQLPALLPPPPPTPSTVPTPAPTPTPASTPAPPPLLPVREQPGQQTGAGSGKAGGSGYPGHRTKGLGDHHNPIGAPSGGAGGQTSGPHEHTHGRSGRHADHAGRHDNEAGSTPATPVITKPAITTRTPIPAAPATTTTKRAIATPAAVIPTPSVAAATSTPAPASVTAAPAATPASTPATPTRTQLAATSRPAGSGRGDPKALAKTHTHRQRAQGRKSSGAGLNTTPAVTAAAAAASAAAVSSTTGAHPARPASQRKALRGAASASSPTPIVTTITKIVGVVPTLVWALIGALLALALALGVRSRLAALRARRLEQQRGELLADVGLLQAALLPVTPERLGPVGTSAAYRPAEGPGAGGDFYDLFALEDGRLAVILGDVSGHGRQALPHTALVRFTLRAYLEAGMSPRSAVQTAGAVLERQLGESFATVAAAIYHPRERTLTYACAGHPPPIVLGSCAIEPITVCSAPPIGAGARTGTRQTVVSVPGRSQICFHTDGVTEARVGQELFGRQKLTQTLAQLGPRSGAPELLERVAAQTDARPDDMAACLLSVEGSEAPPSVLVEELELDREQAGGDRLEPFLLACGVPRGEIVELISSTCAIVERTGSAQLELRLHDGGPEVTLRRDNVALLHPPQVGQRAGVGGLR